jgi:pimeloyl-ACP methyl ester carboxylesterase
MTAAAFDEGSEDRIQVRSPARAESVFLDLAVGRVHCLGWGGSDDAAVLLLHGLNETAHVWDQVAPRLSERFTVLAVDQRGHGHSSWAKDGDYGLEAMVGDLEAVTRYFGLRRFAVAGASMGAAHAIALAARLPRDVTHVAVLDLAPPEDPPETSSRTDPALLRDPRFRKTGMGAWEDVRRVRCPTLVIRGAESDARALWTADAMLARLPQGRLVTIPGAGQGVAQDKPEALARALQTFLLEPDGWWS